MEFNTDHRAVVATIAIKLRDSAEEAAASPRPATTSNNYYKIQSYNNVTQWRCITVSLHYQRRNRINGLRSGTK